MVVDEKLAYKMWCPMTGKKEFSQMSEEEYKMDPNYTCEGHSCMWWEWTNDKEKGYCGITKKVAR